MPGYSPGFVVSFSFNFFVMLMLVFIILKGQLIPFAIKNNLSTFLTIPIAIFFPLGCKILDDAGSKFWAFVGSLMCLGFLSAFSQSSVYGQASCFPTHDQLSAISIGMGLSGVLMNAFSALLSYIRIYVNKSQDSSSFESAIIFFGVASLFLLTSASLYFVERTNKFSNYYYKKQMLYNQSLPKLGTAQQAKSIFIGCNGSWFYIGQLTLTYLCTFIVFPGVTNSEPVTFMDFEGAWYQLSMISTFNVVDTIGRTVCSKINMTDRLLAAWNGFRFIQVALFVVVGLFVKEPFSGKGGDVLKLANFIFFAFGHGVLQTMSIIKAPQSCAKKNQEKVGMMINFVINFGIVIGSLCQVILQLFT